jgi:hypothetical protein
MNASTSLPFDYKTATRARSIDPELAPKEPAGKPDVLPYFLWRTKLPVSTLGLWGSYLKSLLSS